MSSSSRAGSGGVARAFVSDSYKIIDNLDVLLAALDGVRHRQGFPSRSTAVT